MKILAFDTTLQRCSAAIVKVGRDNTYHCLAREEQEIERGHSEILPHMIDRVMKKSDLKITHLNRIATTTGPGSFTGVRIGVSMARAIACATEKTVIGISTLHAIAANYKIRKGKNRKNNSENPIITTIKSGRDICYWQCFSHRLTPITEAAISHIKETQDNTDKLEEYAQIIKTAYIKYRPKSEQMPLNISFNVVGSGAERFTNGLSKIHPTHPSYIKMNASPIESDSLPHATTIAIISASLNPENHPPHPLYLRKADAKIPTS